MVILGMKCFFEIIGGNSGDFEGTDLNGFSGGQAHHTALSHTSGGYDDCIFLLYQFDCDGIEMIIMRVGDQDQIRRFGLLWNLKRINVENLSGIRTHFETGLPQPYQLTRNKFFQFLSTIDEPPFSIPGANLSDI